MSQFYFSIISLLPISLWYLYFFHFWLFPLALCPIILLLITTYFLVTSSTSSSPDFFPWYLFTHYLSTALPTTHVPHLLPYLFPPEVSCILFLLMSLCPLTSSSSCPLFPPLSINSCLASLSAISCPEDLCWGVLTDRVSTLSHTLLLPGWGNCQPHLQWHFTVQTLTGTCTWKINPCHHPGMHNPVHICCTHTGPSGSGS